MKKGFNKNKGVAKAMVMQPLYKCRVCRDKTKFYRKDKHKGSVQD